MDSGGNISPNVGAHSQLSSKLTNVMILIAAVVVLISVDAFASQAVVSQYSEDIRHLIWHEKLVTCCNTVNKQVADAGVAMGGYSVTKSALYADRCEKIFGQIPKDIADLKRIAQSPEQRVIVDDVEKNALHIITILRGTQKAIDDPNIDVAQLRSMHTFKSASEDAEHIEGQLHALCSTASADEVTADNFPHRSRILALKVISFAILNAVYAAFVLFLLGKR
jgi:CHASE3 domain sensor protein